MDCHAKAIDAMDAATVKSPAGINVRLATPRASSEPTHDRTHDAGETERRQAKTHLERVIAVQVLPQQGQLQNQDGVSKIERDSGQGRSSHFRVANRRMGNAGRCSRSS